MSAEGSTPEPAQATKEEGEPAKDEAAETKAEDAPAEKTGEAPAASPEQKAARKPKPPPPLPWCSILFAAMTVGAIVGVAVYWILTTYVFSEGSGLEITQATWDEMTAGKTVFIKFYAPWCGHCKRMKPDWDVLTAEYKESPTILVGDVDCTSEANKKLCTEVGVKGFPTLKHGNPDDLQDYSGGRSLKDIREFAATLKPLCGPARLDLCDDAQKAKIAELRALGHDKREEMIAAKEKEIATIEAEFKNATEALQARYTEANKNKEAKAEEIKNSGLGVLKAVNAFEKKKKSEL